MTEKKEKIEKTTEQKVEELEEKTLDVMLGYFKNTGIKKDDANLAQKTFNSIGRMRGTQNLRDMTQYQIMRDMAENKTELNQFVAVSLPHLNPRKALKA